MREEGPVPPLLLTGHPGLGKSTLLAKWLVLAHSSHHLFHYLLTIYATNSSNHFGPKFYIHMHNNV